MKKILKSGAVECLFCGKKDKTPLPDQIEMHESKTDSNYYIVEYRCDCGAINTEAQKK